MTHRDSKDRNRGRTRPGGGRVLIPSEEHEGGTTCGLTTVNLAYCWGWIPGGSGFSEIPRQVPGGHQFRGINLSDQHACAVTFEDVAFCWGDNDYGQVGDGTTVSRSQPVRVAGGLKFKAVTANTYSYHSCGDYLKLGLLLGSQQWPDRKRHDPAKQSVDPGAGRAAHVSGTGWRE